ncbi:MAG: glycosyltransferase [Actinomycetales bacterium]|nr:glycosyltransferase [Actinomycetales bacterium]
MSGVFAARRGVARDNADLALAQRDPHALVATALRTKSIYAREILAELAWPGHDVAEVEGWAAPEAGAAAGTAGRTDWPRLEPGMDPGWVGRYAQVLAVQTGRPDERVAARRMLEAVWASGHEEVLPDRAVELLLQLRVADRDEHAAELTRHTAVRQAVALAALADLANPALFPGGGEHEGWLAAFNRAVTGDQAPLALTPPPATDGTGPVAAPLPFDRLCAPGVLPVRAPHLVTVVVSAYRPGSHLLTAVRSLIAQTWANLEILVVDDASGPEYAELLTTVEALDPRIRVIRKTLNGGTYRARNTAVRQLRGDFLTVLDSDDWLHPQAIEIAMRVMDEEPGVVATIGEGVRVSEHLELNRPGYQPRVISAASMLVRVHPVMDRLGFFDPTRKGADTEFATRIEASFGKHAVRRLPVVVNVVRRGDTLSSTEFSNGWRHGARHEYKCAYRPWHARIRAGEESPFLDPSAPRRFTEPRRWAVPIAPDLGRPRQIDLCVAGDWRRWGGPQRSMMEEIRAARDAGLRVAVMHLEAFRFMTTRDEPLCAAVTELIASGAVEWIHHDDDVEIGILMIRYPPILQYPPARGARSVRPRHVLIVANETSVEPDGSDQRYVVADVSSRTRELFGCEPAWFPQSPAIRVHLQSQDPSVRLAPWDNPGFTDVDEWAVRSGAPRFAEGPVVVGRYSRDNTKKFPPDWESLLKGYDFGPGYEVRMMGARNTVGKLMAARELTPQDRPANWTLLKHKEVDVLDFLSGLDFFLYLDHPDRLEAFGRTILEGAASGVLTIASPKHKLNFGDTVDYAEPGEAQELIAHYVANPDLYAERVARSQALVRERYGRQLFVDKLLSLDGVGSSGGGAASGPAGSGEGSVTGSADDWRVRTERVRAAADAVRTDALSVVYRSAAADEVADWWGAQLTAHPGDQLPQAMVETAPTAVGAVVTHRDGLVHLAVRDDAPGAREAVGSAGRQPAPGLARLSGIAVPDSWSSEAWWASS